MKRKISVSIEDRTVDHLDELVEEGTFRNKSHVVEFALKKLLEARK